ncbi:MAG: DUF3826 domain-containing protein [Chitinophagaceae bacterium]|nr:MAG: DUF3826 domain-containing protein [Chitinophagaceae bacterium]
MKQLLILSFFFLATFNSGFSQSATNTAEQEAAYTKAINDRSDKIVAQLGVTDPAKAAKVQALIAGQYRSLSNLHTSRDNKIKEIKAKGDSKETTDAAVKKEEEEAQAQINKLHASYINQLSQHLSSDQVIKVKDGMTYNVTPNTYNSYLDMLPNLNADQKAQIMAWLVEAREHAMDAETSDKKHAWFGKYKGRINNYLSAAGFDLKKEGEAWQQRIKEKEAKKNTTKN